MFVEEKGTMGETQTHTYKAVLPNMIPLRLWSLGDPLEENPSTVSTDTTVANQTY